LRAGLVKNRVRFDYTYLYDDDGDRVQETTGGTTSFYLTDTANPTGFDQPIEVWTSTNGSLSSATLNTTYLIGDRVFGQANSSGTLSYLLADGHGDTRLITNASGTVTAALNYDAFGDALNFNASSPPTIFLYPDGPLDPVSGLSMPGDGIRDEEIADDRFIEVDPTSGNKQDPISLHKYLYADGDPVNQDDPSGFFSATEVETAEVIGDGLEGGGASYSAADAFAQTVVLGLEAQSEATAVLADAIESGSNSFASWALSYVTQPLAVIGSYVATATTSSYYVLGAALGATWLNVPLNVWNSMSEEEQWDTNEEFLFNAVNAGQTFVSSTPRALIQAGTWLAEEVNYLIAHNYQWDSSGTTLLPPGAGD
jgi:hypothetical protein